MSRKKMPANRNRGARRFRTAGLPAAAILSAVSVAAALAAGLQTPRFASLRASEVNLRTGPGKRYPVDWVFVRRDLPVEIVGAFDTWRKVRDFTGAVGWVHQSMLSGRRTAIVTADYQKMRDEPSPNARIVARVQAKVVGRVMRCGPDWCRLDIHGIKGWIPRRSLWGVSDSETIE